MLPFLLLGVAAVLGDPASSCLQGLVVVGLLHFPCSLVIGADAARTSEFAAVQPVPGAADPPAPRPASASKEGTKA
jgi:hypothetical protein